jgi:hypothetical protein
LSALGAGFRGGVGEAAENVGEATGLEGLAKYGARQKQRAAESYRPTTDAEIEAASKRGMLPELGLYGKQFLEPYAKSLGEIVGRFGAPTLAGVGVAAALPETVAAAPFLGGALEGIGLGTVGTAAGAGALAATDFPIELGQKQLERKQAGLPADPVSSAAYAIAATALNTMSGHVMAGPIKGLLGKTAAEQAKLLAPQVLRGELTTAQAANQVSGTLSNILKGTAENAVVGTGMMVGNEALSRASVGQDLTSPEAIKQYEEATKGALALAPMFGLAHGLGARGAAIGEIEAAKTQREKMLADAQDAIKKATQPAGEPQLRLPVPTEEQPAPPTPPAPPAPPPPPAAEKISLP